MRPLGARPSFAQPHSVPVRRDDHLKRRHDHMHPSTTVVRAVKAANYPRIGAGYVEAVIRKGLPRGESGRFTDNFVAFDNLAFPVGLFDHPLAAEQLNSPVRSVLDGGEVNEGVGFIHR